MKDEIIEAIIEDEITERLGLPPRKIWIPPDVYQQLQLDIEHRQHTQLKCRLQNLRHRKMVLGE